MYMLFKNGVKKIKSKKTLFNLSFLSLLFSISVFYFLTIPALMLINANEHEVNGYHISDIECRSYKPETIRIDNYTIKLTYDNCMKIKKITPNYAITLKGYTSKYFSFLSELKIGDSIIIGKDYSNTYYYLYILNGMLWLLLSMFMLIVSIIYAKQLIKISQIIN